MTVRQTVNNLGSNLSCEKFTDRDDYIKIRWENILPGMRSQFDKISAALQDLQGEKYDYRFNFVKFFFVLELSLLFCTI